MTLTRKFSVIPLVLLVLVAVLLVQALQGLQVLNVTVHAVERHGIKAVYASHCTDDPGKTDLYNPQLGRWAHICWIPELSKWGVSIVDDAGHEITSFIKEKLDSIDDVIRYLQNNGYDWPL